MNRKNSLTILYNESWMNEADWVDEISEYRIEAAITPECHELGENVVWLERYDDNILQIILQHDPPGLILRGLRAWFDTGEAEVPITEDNYLDKNELGEAIYPHNEIYCKRKGVYDDPTTNEY